MATARKATATKRAATKTTSTAAKTTARKPLRKSGGKSTTTTDDVAAVQQAVQRYSHLAEVPERRYLDGYVQRNVSGKGKNATTEFDAFDKAFAKGHNVLIEGPTGPGKTTSVMAWAAKRGLRFGTVSSSTGTDMSQLIGRFKPDETGQAIATWVDGVVTDLIRNGGVLLINEGNFLPERISTVLFPVTDARRSIVLQDKDGEIVKAHRPTTYKRIGKEVVEQPCWCADPGSDACKSKWLLIVLDMNPDYEGTRPLNKAFRNRFAVQLWWDYDEAVEKQLIASKSLRELGSSIRQSDEYDTPVSTNMLIEFEDIAADFGMDFAVQNFVNHFDSEERDSVKIVVNTYKDNVDAELFGDQDDEDQDDDADLDDDDELEVDEEVFDWAYASSN